MWLQERVKENSLLTWEHEILNTTETMLINSLDKKVTYEKYDCLIQTVSCVIVCLFLLVVISTNC